jgi:hypothetical protein
MFEYRYRHCTYRDRLFSTRACVDKTIKKWRWYLDPGPEPEAGENLAKDQPLEEPEEEGEEEEEVDDPSKISPQPVTK